MREEIRQPGALTRVLARSPTSAAFLTVASAFCVYFCMYAFRKPFAAASWSEDQIGDITLKSALIIGQLLGYTAAKFISIKVCSELTRRQRAPFLTGLIILAELALLLLALGPTLAKVLAMLVNGLALGSVWGVVTRYLEGRRTSELLLAGLSCSFIIASGIVKDVGRWLMDSHGVSEDWMPFATGMIFLLPFLGFLWLLDQVPAPTAEDEADRNQRTPMKGKGRHRFLVEFLPGMVLLLVGYLLLTVYRDYRDNFGVEIFAGLGYAEEPAIFSRSELWVGLGVLAALALLSVVRDHRRGLICSFGLMVTGTVMMGISTPLLDAGRISGLQWMIAVGLGAYLAYVPFGSLLFERVMAATRFPGTAVFTICLADAVGYTGSVAMLAGKDYFAGEVEPLEFFRQLTFWTSIGATVFLILGGFYFLRRTRGLGDEIPR
ncbi:MAG TPA: hypothetical protein EYN79_03840 [Planctomycetes bacterium]|nr:hypothetical protein [Planctomycetota bacterium]HIN79543.1 hypothetical protein [Planctomycetota bacterium]